MAASDKVGSLGNLGNLEIYKECQDLDIATPLKAAKIANFANSL
jgi:hypothetical protein